MNNNIKLEIESIDFIATWKYNCKNAECVCKRNLYLPTSNEIEQNNITTNNIVIGECGHGLHKTCMETYFKTCNNICPFDKLEWKQAIVNNPKYYVTN